ncbi:MAG: hypothetical protein PVI50_07780 [Gammaproteobacteria bacterium]|jgi:hypothetical protein
MNLFHRDSLRCIHSARFGNIAALLFLSVMCVAISGCQPPDPGAPQGGPVPATATLPGLDKKDVQPVTVDYPETGVDLGWGWDTEEGVPRPSVCVEFSIAEDKGQTKYMTIAEVTGSSELMQSMNMSAAASVKTVAYKASGKASFAKNTRINSFSSNFVLNASVDNGVRYAAPLEPGSRPVVRNAEDQQVTPDAGSIRLSGAALRLAQQRDLDSFLDACGDSFVAALYGGANLTAVLTVENSSREEQRKTSAAFTGSGWGAKVKAAASSDKDGKEANSKLSMRFFQTGGRGDTIPATKADFLKKLDSLSTEAGDYPATYRASLLPYTALANWPDRDIEISTDEQEQLVNYWSAYTGIYTDIQYILEDPDAFQQLTAAGTFGALDVEVLRILQDEVHAALRQLRDDALRCAEPDPGPDEDCNFNERDYLDPLAFRIRMPLPKTPMEDETCPCKWPVSQDAGDAAIDAIVNYYVRDPNGTVCRNNPVAADCLTNAEIRRWRGRVGRKLLALPDTVTATRLREKQAAGVAACAGAEDKATCLSRYSWFEVLESPAYAWIDSSRSGQEADPLVLLEQ